MSAFQNGGKAEKTLGMRLYEIGLMLLYNDFLT